MSWILTRKRDGVFQMYRDADIYGRGKWEGNDCPWWHFPEQYRDKDHAEQIIRREQEKAPEWDYYVRYYE